TRSKRDWSSDVCSSDLADLATSMAAPRTFTASASVEVLGAAIDVAKSADNASVSAGDAIGFTVTVTNNGTGIARNVALNDALPRSEERRVGKQRSHRAG